MERLFGRQRGVDRQRLTGELLILAALSGVTIAAVAYVVSLIFSPAFPDSPFSPILLMTSILATVLTFASYLLSRRAAGLEEQAKQERRRLQDLAHDLEMRRADAILQQLESAVEQSSKLAARIRAQESQR